MVSFILIIIMTKSEFSLLNDRDLIEYLLCISIYIYYILLKFVQNKLSKR